MLTNYITIPHELWLGIHETGSRYICNPPVLDTDHDYVICTLDVAKLNKFLVDNNFVLSIAEEEGYKLQKDGFCCYRRGCVNLIVTENYEWYLKWTKATKLAKKLNLLKKEDRIILFKFVLYGEL